MGGEQATKGARPRRPIRKPSPPGAHSQRPYRRAQWRVPGKRERFPLKEKKLCTLALSIGPSSCGHMFVSGGEGRSSSLRTAAGRRAADSGSTTSWLRHLGGHFGGPSFFPLRRGRGIQHAMERPQEALFVRLTALTRIAPVIDHRLFLRRGEPGSNQLAAFSGRRNWRPLTGPRTGVSSTPYPASQRLTNP